jgi:putative sigma-54 modulation protein
MSRKSKAAEFIDEVYNITVTGRHVTVTDSMKEYAIEKISKIEKFSPRIIDAIVTMDIQRYEHRVDIVLKVNNLKIKSHAVSGDMYTSIDQAVHKLETQVLRYKDRIQDHQNKGSAVTDMKVDVLRSLSEQELLEVNDEIESETRFRLFDKYTPHRIVNTTTRPLKTLTDGEAVMKVELSGDNFLIYRSEETQQLRVIYRRKDGDFGVIQAEGA